MTSFLLGGRAWLVQAIDHKQRIVTAVAAPRGKKPAWGGFAAKGLGFVLSQRIKRVIVDEPTYGYLSEPAAIALAEYRDDFVNLLGPSGASLQGDQKSWRWWTFAGGAINETLKYAIAALTGWKIVADSFRLRFEGEGLSEIAVREAVGKLVNPAIWEDLPFWQQVISQLPPYRLSKFQRALPLRYQMEMVGNSLLDLAGTREYLSTARGEPEVSQQGLLDRVVAELPAASADSVPLAIAKREIRRIDDDIQLRDLCADIMSRSHIALDVETTIGDHELCIVQIGVPEYNAIIDARAIVDLSPLAAVLETTTVTKIIHNAAFEREVFSQLNLSILNVVDTVELSRRVRGRQPDGHSLSAICRRELGLRLDKSQKMSDWVQRPLTHQQLDYAALAVEVLWNIYAVLVESRSNSSQSEK